MFKNVHYLWRCGHCRSNDFLIISESLFEKVDNHIRRAAETSCSLASFLLAVINHHHHEVDSVSPPPLILLD
jgi:hypothetical protein